MLEDEKENFRVELKKLRLLPHKFLKIGIALLLFTIALVIALKIYGEYKLPKEFAESVVLLSLLLISISKDKIEDELTLRLRGQAFVFAFIWGVTYTAVTPFINILADLIFGANTEDWAPLTVFRLLFSMLFCQISFYHFAKRFR